MDKSEIVGQLLNLREEAERYYKEGRLQESEFFNAMRAVATLLVLFTKAGQPKIPTEAQ